MRNDYRAASLTVADGGEYSAEGGGARELTGVNRPLEAIPNDRWRGEIQSLGWWRRDPRSGRHEVCQAPDWRGSDRNRRHEVDEVQVTSQHRLTRSRQFSKLLWLRLRRQTGFDRANVPNHIAGIPDSVVDEPEDLCVLGEGLERDIRAQ